MEPRSGRVFVARTQRWNYTQTGLSNTTHVLNDLERNAMHRESGYTKHIGVSSTSCEVGSAIFLERVCCLDLLSFTVDRKKGCTVVCDSQNNCARIPLNSYHTPACSAMAS